jgi:S-adenosylmethionine:tRNA ribosyltransferase-isomerase
MTEGHPARHAMADYDYALPPELIAQVPLDDRSGSRLLHLDRTRGTFTDRRFPDLVELLRPNDLLVMNDSRVIPARLLAHRESGGKAEALLLRKQGDGTWLALVRPARRLSAGERVVVPAKDPALPSDSFEIVAVHGEGQASVRLSAGLENGLPHYGRVPLPPYIRDVLDDDERYQTLYARDSGSAAAPTAGLHFTDEIFAQLDARGVRRAFVTLHVGLDTFRPVTVDFADEHAIHQEWCEIPPETVDALRQTRDAGGRVIAVGTTSARTLESFGELVDDPTTTSFSAMTGIYITPGYRWRVVDAMVTNFHLPKSTLLLMMSSFAGKELLFRAYRHAIDERYRFFSFGDAMFIA